MKNEDLFLEQIPLGPMENFVYMIGSKSTREVALVDPAWDIDFLLNFIEQQDLKLSSILVTHYHPDHIGGGMGGHSIEGIADVIEKSPVKIFVNKHEAEGVKKVTGVSESDIKRVDSGDKLKVGNIEVEFLHTPGHTPGSQCFKIKNTLVSGDTLFVNGCGRVDLPGSNSEDMYHSIQKLAALPNDTILLPGHNYSDVPSATMADTKKANVYMRIDNLESWKIMMGH